MKYTLTKALQTHEHIIHSRTSSSVYMFSCCCCCCFLILPFIKHGQHVLLYAARAGHGSEEESRHGVRVRGPEPVQEHAQSAEPASAPQVCRPHVLVERALSLSLQRLDVLATLQVRDLFRTESTQALDHTAVQTSHIWITGITANMKPEVEVQHLFHVQ